MFRFLRKKTIVPAALEKRVRFANGTTMPPNRPVILGGKQASNREAYEKRKLDKRLNELVKAERRYEQLLPSIKRSLSFESYLPFVAYGRLGGGNLRQAHINLYEAFGRDNNRTNNSRSRTYLGAFAYVANRRRFVPTESKQGIWYKGYGNADGIYYEAFVKNMADPRRDKFMPKSRRR